ncbi:conserved Plasmodium protein, unknown function [Plasmodium ovale]|uniref:Uncharacterized protein n=2 Tax=Plasmodium ovale TaxID=36330 RepID=A0A1A8VWW6_PLAOA|nr:conserved Plasmodium protein, unknown function [Plasmodium ovale curtisi]SBS85075.1 conserved Plasmodium protein, unknown function [Plasmodium ovale curtisi]SCQ16107.1 conserved Plasmodium protein, unknown function [Plasmodium ovale]
METAKALVPLIVGSYGLSLSSYLMYENRKKGKWEKINGHIDNVTLKYAKNLFQGSFYLTIKYYYFINNKRIENSKDYKICVHIFTKIKDQKNVETNEYAQNVFEQAGKEKNINIAYNPNNINESEPLIYIYENDIIAKHKLMNKVKNVLFTIKMKLNEQICKFVDPSKITAKFFLNTKEGNTLEVDEIGETHTSCTQNVEETKEYTQNRDATKEHVQNEDAESNPDNATQCCEHAQNEKKLINSYDINNLFPIYMFSCSLFLYLSFFLKKRIYFVRKELLQKKI